ncbi:unnamed protein product [Auanema sp. JU1783]|nr:unnamed protein product [Auanema sp. JU1783]
MTFHHKWNEKSSRTTTDTVDLYECLNKSKKFTTPDFLEEQNDIMIEITAKSWEPSIGSKGMKNIFDRLSEKKKPTSSPRSILVRNNEKFIQRLYEIYVIASEVNSIRTKNVTQQIFNGMQIVPTLEFFTLSKIPCFDPRIVLNAPAYKPLYEFPIMKEMKSRFSTGNNSVITGISNGQVLLQNSTSSSVYCSELAAQVAKEYHTENSHQVLNIVCKFGEDDWNMMIAHAVAALFMCPICSKHILYQFSKLHFEQERDAQRWSEKLHVVISSVNEPISRKFLARHIQTSSDQMYVDPSTWLIDSNQDVKDFLDTSSMEMLSQFPYEVFGSSVPKLQTQEIILNEHDELFHEDRSAHDDAFASLTMKKAGNEEENEDLYVTDVSVLLNDTGSAERSNQTSQNPSLPIEDSMSDSSAFSPSICLDNLKTKKSVVDLTITQIEKSLSTTDMNETKRKLMIEQLKLLEKYIECITEENYELLRCLSH